MRKAKTRPGCGVKMPDPSEPREALWSLVRSVVTREQKENLADAFAGNSLGFSAGTVIVDGVVGGLDGDSCSRGYALGGYVVVGRLRCERKWEI